MLVSLMVAVFVAAVRPAPPPPKAAPAPVCVAPAAALVPTTPAKVRVMLPDLEVTPRFADARAALGQVVAGEAARVEGYELLSADEVRAVLDQEANKQLLGCDETSCLAELAEALDAELVISGRIGETPDGATLVALTLINARAIVVVNRVSVQWRGSHDQLADVVKTSTQRLLLEPKQRPPGGLRITGAPEQARVFVDGIDRSSGFVAGRIAPIEIGVHDVSIEAADKLPTTISFVVQSDADSVVDGTLENVPVPAVWLWVGGVGAVVAGAVATGALVYFSGPGSAVIDARKPDLNDIDTLRGLGK